MSKVITVVAEEEKKNPYSFQRFGVKYGVTRESFDRFCDLESRRLERINKWLRINDSTAGKKAVSSYILDGKCLAILEGMKESIEVPGRVSFSNNPAAWFVTEEQEIAKEAKLKAEASGSREEKIKIRDELLAQIKVLDESLKCQ